MFEVVHQIVRGGKKQDTTAEVDLEWKCSSPGLVTMRWGRYAEIHLTVPEFFEFASQMSQFKDSVSARMLLLSLDKAAEADEWNRMTEGSRK